MDSLAARPRPENPRAAPVLDAGIVDQDLDRADVLLHLADRRGDSLGLSHVEDSCSDAMAFTAQLRRCDLQPLAVASIQDDSSAGRRQAARKSKANAACRACDEGAAAGQIEHVRAHPIPQLLSDDSCEQWLTGEMRCEIVGHQSAHGLAGFDGGARLMRFEDHLLEHKQRLGTYGSLGNASSPAPPSLPSTKASTRACSSTIEPRATLIKIPSGPRASSTARSTKCREPAPPAAATTRISLSRARPTSDGSNLYGTSSNWRWS